MANFFPVAVWVCYCCILWAQMETFWCTKFTWAL